MKGNKSNWLHQFECFKNERRKHFFCNFGIFKIDSNLAVREHRLLQSFGVIVKDRIKMEIIEKKERNHFELEDIETVLRLNEYPKKQRMGSKIQF